MRTILPAIGALLFGVACNAPGPAENETTISVDCSEWTEVVERCFEGMLEHDSAKLAHSMLPNAAITRLRWNDSGAIDLYTTTGQEFIDQLRQPGPGYLERIWNPMCIGGEEVATVRAPYDFHVDTVFSHCGMEHFTLIQSTEGWRIQSVAYTFYSKSESTCKAKFGTP